jgi:putative hydrolase of the HAD superfamily
MQQIKNIIFDLGGVIINLDMPATAKAFTELAQKYEVSQTDFHAEHPVFKEFEIGAISAQSFRNTIKDLLHKNISDAEIDFAWNAMLLDIPAERLALLSALKSKYNTFLFSNTNEIHYHAFNKILFDVHGYNLLDDFFQKAYYSHIMGKRKPNADSFLQILNENNLHPAETLFLDDTQMHLDGAAQLGIHTQKVTAENSILEILKNF